MFIIGMWLVIIGAANLDVIHKSSPIGQELALKSRYPISLPKSWQDDLFRAFFGAGLVFICIGMWYV